MKIQQIIEDLNLDVEEDLDIYIEKYSAFYVGKYRIILAVCPDGDTSYSINGSVEMDSIDPFIGAMILRRLLKEWKILSKKIVEKGIALFCYPVETNGKFCLRVRTFQLASFVLEDESGLMVFKGF